MYMKVIKAKISSEKFSQNLSEYTCKDGKEDKIDTLKDISYCVNYVNSVVKTIKKIDINTMN